MIALNVVTFSLTFCLLQPGEESVSCEMVSRRWSMYQQASTLTQYYCLVLFLHHHPPHTFTVSQVEGTHTYTDSIPQSDLGNTHLHCLNIAIRLWEHTPTLSQYRDQTWGTHTYTNLVLGLCLIFTPLPRTLSTRVRLEEHTPSLTGCYAWIGGQHTYTGSVTGLDWKNTATLTQDQGGVERTHLYWLGIVVRLGDHTPILTWDWGLVWVLLHQYICTLSW